jgi:L-fuconolactonase
LIVDSHSHAWDHWPYEPRPPDAHLRGDVAQLLFEMDNHGVDLALVVAAEIEHNRSNNAYVAGAVGRHPDRLLHVADVDSRWSRLHHTPGAADRLRALVRAYEPVGLTHYVGRENDGWLASDEGMEFFGVAAEHRLIVSLAASPAWQEDIRSIARAYPGMPILCHHLAGIRRRAANGLRDVLASRDCQNIFIKVSGFYYGADRQWDFPFPREIEIVRELYRQLGPHRLVWASDFPASRRWITYTQSLEMVRTHCDFIAVDHLPAILGGNMRTILEMARGGGVEAQ